jgi:hypothetical protein
MRIALIMSLLLAAPAVARSDDSPRFHVSGAAGFGLGSFEAAHLGAGLDMSLNRYLSLGADLSYSYLPLAPQARGGGHRVYWALATLTGTRLPSARVSPHLTLGYGIGRYMASGKDVEFGKAAALGAGLRARLGARTDLFLEGRLGLLDGITAADGGHIELPVRAGVRFGF